MSIRKQLVATSLSLLMLAASGFWAWVPTQAATLRPHTGKNLPYRGGPVMHRPALYAIFWLPDGYHYRPDGTPQTDQDYENLVLQFLGDLSGSNYYGLVRQYSDHTGPISGSIDVADSALDTNPFPGGRGGPSKPMSSADMRSEITSVAQQLQWDNQKGETEFLVYTPYNVSSCYGGNAQKNIKPTCTYRPKHQGSCGYHSWFRSGGDSYIYSVIYDPTSFCHGWQRKISDDTAPNGDVYADMAVDVTSHELFESVTDPFLNAWAASNSDEIGDKCSSVIGAIADDGSDITLKGDPYLVQKEWSNSAGGCVI